MSAGGDIPASSPTFALLTRGLRRLGGFSRFGGRWSLDGCLYGLGAATLLLFFFALLVVPDELDQGDRGVVAPSRPELDDSSVASGPGCVTARQIDQHLFDEIHALHFSARFRTDSEPRHVCCNRARG